MFRRLWNGPGECEFVEQAVLSDESGCECLDKSLAVQSQRDEADINVIVKRFGLTGQIPVGMRLPTYEDFSNAPDTYQGAMAVVLEAQASFLKLPPAIRNRFGGDPGEFVAFCSDPANLPELRKMGLAPPEARREVEPAPSPVGN